MFNLITFENYAILFFIYSFFGWSIETIGEYIKSKKFVNRGFLLGPICPVYGFGAIFITLFLSQYKYDWFVVFGLSAILCGSLEYFTSYIMEKLFKSRWWDYSNFKYNINGRVCLEVIALFAIAGILIIDFLNPLFEKFIISNISDRAKDIITSITCSLFFVDVILSFNIMNKIKDIKSSATKQLKDNTEEISIKVRETIMEKSAVYRRILEAFPQAFATKVKEGRQKIVDTANKMKEKTVDTANKVKEKTMDSVNYVKERTADSVNKIKNITMNNFNTAKIRTIENVNYIKNQGEKSIGFLQQELKNKKEENHNRKNVKKVRNALRIRRILETIQGAKIIKIKEKNTDGKNEKLD